MWQKVILSGLTVVSSRRQSGDEFHLLQQKSAEKSLSGAPSHPNDAESCDQPLRCHCLDQDVVIRKYQDWNLCDKKPVYEDRHGYFPFRFENVGHLVDLYVENLTNFIPNDPEKNGNDLGRKCLGTFNIKAPGSLKVKYTLVKTGTKEPIPVDPTNVYEMSIFDLDESYKGMKEVVHVRNYSDLGGVRKPFKEIEIENEVKEAWFESTEANVTNPDPDNMFDLTTDQMDASFNVQYKGTNTWTIDFEAHGRHAKGGRNFWYSGTSCASAERHQCECPPKPVPPPPPCPEENLECDCLSKDYSKFNFLVDWNLCNATVERCNPKVDKCDGPYGFPLRYKKVTNLMDLIITNLTDYKPFDDEKTGKSGCLGQLNLISPGDVTMQFSLVKTGTSDLVPKATTKEMTVFDFDRSMRGMTEWVGVSDYSSYRANVLVPKIEGGTAWFKATEVDVPNPDTSDLDVLTSEQIGASFSVAYQDRSQWTVQFKAVEGKKARNKGGRNFLFAGTSCASENRHNCRCLAPKEPPIVQR